MDSPNTVKSPIIGMSATEIAQRIARGEISACEVVEAHILVAATRVRPGEESDRQPGNSPIERTAYKIEQGSAGLPVGVQVAAYHWREDVVLAVMSILEQHFNPHSAPCSVTCAGLVIN